MLLISILVLIRFDLISLTVTRMMILVVLCCCFVNVIEGILNGNQ